MNTRSQGRSSDNLKGRSKSASSSRNNISIEIQDNPSTSKHRVLHSPIVRNTSNLTRVQSNINLSSNFEDPNISIMSNLNPISQPFVPSEGQPRYETAGELHPVLIQMNLI